MIKTQYNNLFISQLAHKKMSNITINHKINSINYSLDLATNVATAEIELSSFIIVGGTSGSGTYFKDPMGESFCLRLNKTDFNDTTGEDWDGTKEGLEQLKTKKSLVGTVYEFDLKKKP
jgi:hypothetical protein